MVSDVLLLSYLDKIGLSLTGEAHCEKSLFVLASRQKIPALKVLTNEKRGGLAVVSFDRSPFKLFTLRFSNIFVLAPSCERPKTTQRPLFLSFESNNCFPITVLCRRLMKKSGKLACHVENSNITIGSLPTHQTSHGLMALFEKIYYGEPIFTDFTNIAAAGSQHGW